jgi:hypothetical protein
MHCITPDDERSNAGFLSVLGEAGFGQVLQGLGEHFGLDGILCCYASFIAVSHCSGSCPHVDDEATDGKAFNWQPSSYPGPVLCVGKDNLSVEMDGNEKWHSAYVGCGHNGDDVQLEKSKGGPFQRGNEELKDL